MRLPDNILAKLRPYQVEPASLELGCLADRVNFLDMSPTGTGKTYSACATLATLDVPTLVVVPKPAKTPWRRAAAYMGANFSLLNYEMIRTGRTPFGKWEKPLPKDRAFYHTCKNCQCFIDGNSDPCICRPDGEHELIEHMVDHDYGKFIWHPGIDTLVFDEVHRCSGDDTLHARMLAAGRRQKKRVLGLSATAGESPMQFRALGYVLGLHTLKEKKDPHGNDGYNSGLSFENWSRRYGCKWTSWGGFQWLVSNDKRQREIMAEIRKEIVPRCGARIDLSTVPDFPKVSIHCQAYDLEEADRIKKLYEQMADPLKALEERKLEDKDPDCAFTRILRARQEIELLKVPLFEELTKEYLEKGCHVALFLNFSETIAQLSKRLKCKAIVDGSPDGVKNRDGYIDAFENDIAKKILVNVSAGAECIGLRDLCGEHPRVGLVSPTFSARAMKQLFGRLPREGSLTPSTYYVVFAADTVEHEICDAVGQKLDNNDTFNDADLTPRNLLEARSKRRAKKAKEKL